jgi:hypothetical protein
LRSVPQTSTTFIAECYWVGIQEEDLRLLDRRAEKSAIELAREGDDVRYMGSTLIREDEVVLCFFHGTSATVHAAAGRAEIPFERILETTDSRRGSWMTTTPEES